MSGTDAIRVERVFHATAQTVFDAWGDPESLAVWMCPGAGIERATATADFRVGGRFRIVMHAPERDFAQHGEYLEIDPPKRIVLTWISEWIPAGEAATRVTVSLEPLAGGCTRLVLVHEGLAEGDAYAGHPEGWRVILDKFDAALAAHTEGPA
jgi:uncharacterized protein YndB with AHSA1/START domain